MGPFQSKTESLNFLFNRKTSIWRTQLFFKALAIKHKLVQHVLLLAATHKTFDVIKAKPKRVLYIVGGAELLMYTLVHGTKGVMFVSSKFGIAQTPYIVLHCPTSWQTTTKSCVPSNIYKFGGFDLIIARLLEVYQFQTFHWHQLQFHHGMNKTLRILRRCLTS